MPQMLVRCLPGNLPALSTTRRTGPGGRAPSRTPRFREEGLASARPPGEASVVRIRVLRAVAAAHGLPLVRAAAARTGWQRLDGLHLNLVATVRAAIAAGGWRCRWCGGPANTVDHVVALAEGGARLDPSNLVACCKGCTLNAARRPSAAWPPDGEPVRSDSRHRHRRGGGSLPSGSRSARRITGPSADPWRRASWIRCASRWLLLRIDPGRA
jgi:hypothetical protein